eukprot:6468450-Prymnesium_polylepis.1
MPLNSAKWSCTARSQSLKFKHTHCAPASQPGRGLIFLPENRSPRGYGRSKWLVVRCCILPTANGGSAASRRAACDTCCSSVRPTSDGERSTCNPSSWLQSAAERPSSFNNLSSLIEEMGRAHLGGEPRRKWWSGTDRMLRYCARNSLVVFLEALTFLSSLRRPFACA